MNRGFLKWYHRALWTAGTSSGDPATTAVERPKMKVIME
jgi:hypothetical protein